MTALVLRGRGDVTATDPSAGNGWRGEVEISDPAGAADVYGPDPPGAVKHP
jgi:hypothetical protein